MRFLNCQQGTPEWRAARCGHPTASCFADAVSTVGGLDERQRAYVDMILGGASETAALSVAGYKAKPSADSVRRALAGEVIERPSDTAIRYADDLAIERISGKPYGIPAKTWLLDRGHEMEFAARMKYEATRREFVTEAGLCIDDDDVFAYSTDGLVGADGLIEVKAPIDSTKIRVMWQTGDVSEYMHQMQGGMWITGRAWCDFLMYVPDLAAVGKDLYVKRVHRDNAFIDSMVERLAEFDGLVQANVAILRAGAPAAVEA